MSQQRPYHRIWRPLKGYKLFDLNYMTAGKKPTLDYLCDNRFACQQEVNSMLISVQLIMQDLYSIFNYVEPCDDNIECYSHRLYELLIRTATEVEASMKGILSANGYQITDESNMESDYFKLAGPLRLHEYKVWFNRWESDREFVPYADWSGDTYKSLKWYRAYNEIKHNRSAKFNRANLLNLMNAIAGLLCILHAQFGERIVVAGYEGISVCQDSEAEVRTSRFFLESPNFPDDQKYDFIWDDLKKESDSVINYQF